MSVFGHVAYGLSLGLVTNALLRPRPETLDYPEDVGQVEDGGGAGALELPEPGVPPAPPPAIGAAQRGPAGAAGSPDDDPTP